MKTTGFWVCFLLIPLVGTVRKPVPLSRQKPLAPSNQQIARAAALHAQLGQFASIFRAGHYQQAAQLCQTGYQDSLLAGERDLAARFLTNLGSCQYALHQYQEALRTFVGALKVAESLGDNSLAGALEANISSLYSEMGEHDAAAQSLESGLQRLADKDSDSTPPGIAGETRRAARPALLVQLAMLRARQGRMDEALELFRESIEGADRAGDLNLYAKAWNRLGGEYLLRNELPQAEQALLESYRIRKLNRLGALDSSYLSLGRLRLVQGDFRSASVLLDQALEYSRKPGRAEPAWKLYAARGRVRLAQGRLAAALEDLRAAVRLLRIWRLGAPPSDATRVSVEGLAEKTYDALIEAGNKLYFLTGDPALARETFEAAEENRAASLRALLAEAGDWRRALPAAYWETLAGLQAAEAELLRDPGAGATQKVQHLRAALGQIEAGAGSNPAIETPGLLERTRKLLGTDRALLSFHLGQSESYLWAVAPEKFSVYRLPPKPVIAAAVERFARMVRAEDPEAAALGEQLLQTLFGSLDPLFHGKPNWLLALDEGLFDLPFATLVTGRRAGAPVYLVERHALQIISGAALLAANRSADAFSGPFLGVGDPIFSAADPRGSGPRPPDEVRLPSPLNLFASPVRDSAQDLQLARLPGSAGEIEACGRAWRGTPPILLKGTEASRQSLQDALRRRPAVVHFATHVLESRQRSRDGVIVLSLSSQGQNEVLSPVQIATWRLGAGLVVLSGCSSGTAQALPGSGLMGLTRAWLAAGAGAVIASRWPTPDDSGALFLRLYQHLRERPGAGPAVALQKATVDMIRSGTWRASPRHWGGYFGVGNQ